MFDPQGFPNICTRNRISEDHINFFWDCAVPENIHTHLNDGY